jgi:hypothetical protein
MVGNKFSTSVFGVKISTHLEEMFSYSVWTGVGLNMKTTNFENHVGLKSEVSLGGKGSGNCSSSTLEVR